MSLFALTNNGQFLGGESLRTLAAVLECNVLFFGHNNRVVSDLLFCAFASILHQSVCGQSEDLSGNNICQIVVNKVEVGTVCNTYVAAGFNIEIMILDENFNKLSSHICADQTLMTQGLYSDGEYVYDPRYLEDRAVHLMVVEDMEGNLVSSASIYGLSGAEPEHMYKIDGTMYIGCNFSGWLYRVEIIPQNKSKKSLTLQKICSVLIWT